MYRQRPILAASRWRGAACRADATGRCPGHRNPSGRKEESRAPHLTEGLVTASRSRGWAALEHSPRPSSARFSVTETLQKRPSRGRHRLDGGEQGDPPAQRGDRPAYRSRWRVVSGQSGPTIEECRRPAPGLHPFHGRLPPSQSTTGHGNCTQKNAALLQFWGTRDGKSPTLNRAGPNVQGSPDLSVISAPCMSSHPKFDGDGGDCSGLSPYRGSLIASDNS